MSVTEEQILKKFEELKASKFSGYQGKTDSDLLMLSRELCEADDPDLQPDFLSAAKEKKRAKELIRRYVKEYLIETYADKMMVRHLVYLEVVQGRLQDQLNEMHKSESVVPIQMLDILQKNLKAITEARVVLGLTRDRQKQDINEAGKALDLLKIKFRKWREQNQASRTIKCPCCGEMILLKIRTEQWEAQKHPYFQDRVLGSPVLVKLVQEHKLSELDLSELLGTSVEYIQWLISKWPKKEQNASGTV